MSVWRDMARDAGTHIDAGISLDEAAAMHEAEYAAEHERAMQEQAQQDEAERTEWYCTCPGEPRGVDIRSHDRDCRLWNEPF